MRLSHATMLMLQEVSCLSAPDRLQAASAHAQCVILGHVLQDRPRLMACERAPSQRLWRRSFILYLR